MYNPKIVKLERRHRLLSMDTSEPARFKDEYDEEDDGDADDMMMTKTSTFSPWKHAKHAKINVILHFYIKRE